MSVIDFLNIPKLRKQNKELTSKNEQLEKLFFEVGALDTISITEKINELKIKEYELRDNISFLEKELNYKQEKLIVLDDEISFESISLYKPKFSFINSEEYKSKLVTIRNKQKEMIKEKTAVIMGQNWTMNNSKAQGKKMQTNIMNLLLRSFNNECDYCVDNVKFNNIDSHKKRIEKSFDTLNKLGDLFGAYIADDYQKLKFDELHLAFEYQEMKQEEKEEQKRIRADLREQAKLEQEIKQAREKLKKEKTHFNNALRELDKKIAECNSDELKQELNNQKCEIEANLNKLLQEEAAVDYRENNAQAGYVYIISNIGAFGENVYKIGMTRRLEPMERVDELGDASVPFSFDVHAMIFAENARELEKKLHEHFQTNRVNKINCRKEFFKVELNEIEKIIRENYNKTFDIIDVAPAEQFRKGLVITS